MNTRTREETAKIIAEAAYDVLRQHDNDSIQEVDWRELVGAMAAKAVERLFALEFVAPDGDMSKLHPHGYEGPDTPDGVCVRCGFWRYTRRDQFHLIHLREGRL